ncbi:MAG TPA: hypothetical protein VFH78_08480 [Candidatus Thermoplasmatota archaeon]|nr:hypothetical protein [Candidatus Thermoplasmatota archaeon]
MPKWTSRIPGWRSESRAKRWGARIGWPLLAFVVLLIAIPTPDAPRPDEAREEVAQEQAGPAAQTEAPPARAEEPPASAPASAGETAAPAAPTAPPMPWRLGKGALNDDIAVISSSREWPGYEKHPDTYTVAVYNNASKLARFTLLFDGKYACHFDLAPGESRECYPNVRYDGAGHIAWARGYPLDVNGEIAPRGWSVKWQMIAQTARVIATDQGATYVEDLAATSSAAIQVVHDSGMAARAAMDCALQDAPSPRTCHSIDVRVFNNGTSSLRRTTSEWSATTSEGRTIPSHSVIGDVAVAPGTNEEWTVRFETEPAEERIVALTWRPPGAEPIEVQVPAYTVYEE